MAIRGGSLILAAVFFACGVSGCDQNNETERQVAEAIADIRAADGLIGIEFTDEEIELMAQDIIDNRNDIEQMRGVSLPNSVRPALFFRPVPGVGCDIDTEGMTLYSSHQSLARPDDINELTFYSIAQLAHLVRTQQITSTELTGFYLERLKRYGPTLEAVVTLTEERAMASAKKADEEISAGNYRGALHGIPYGAKDLLAVEGYPTTWGATPYRDQVIDDTAAVVKKLDEAGAVLVAKTTLGALAWGDVWFGGKTRNPWNLDEGSSGSSAGSAATVSAGLVPFAIGSETWGSIVSPATRVGITGLRPTFGRVSKHGAMALSWSMDKLGPLCRTVEDCAIVFAAINGCDELDPSSVSASFNYPANIDISNLRVGYLKRDFESGNGDEDSEYKNRDLDLATLETLRGLGATLVPVGLPDMPISSMSYILSVEAAAAFDDLTRSNQDELLVRQERRAWPNAFRAARLIPAVEYVQANRLRTLLIAEMNTLFDDIDVLVAPSFQGDQLLATNLTGHPAVFVPNGAMENGSRSSITFVGQHFGDATVLTVADLYQQATDHHLAHPPGFD